MSWTGEAEGYVLSAMRAERERERERERVGE